ncbi:MAG TPA: DUF3089 domain-containing protein [Parvularculaceae bacterium]|nr:DUF3089 domain-containing protein [Parvularculaceae bacterium]
MLSALVLAAAMSVGPVDYSKNENWLCRPGRKDACTIVDLDVTIVSKDGSISVDKFAAADDPKIDCFYVYPTVSLDPTQNSDMTANDEEYRVIASQFARFGSVCRTFAPLYRQTTLTALRDNAFTKESLDLAYDDVLAAFRYYMAHDNNGRPFALIGHSQGSRHLSRLIAEEIDGKPIEKRMLSAILAGHNTLVPKGKDVGGDFKATPLCRSNAQTGCVITYVSFRADAPPPADSRFARSIDPSDDVACTNPAALANSASNAALHSFLGAAGAGQASAPQAPWTSDGKEIKTLFVEAPGLLSARCVLDEHGGYLGITVNADQNDPRTDTISGDVVVNGQVVPEWGLHLLDVSEAQGDLINIIKSEAKSMR